LAPGVQYEVEATFEINLAWRRSLFPWERRQTQGKRRHCAKNNAGPLKGNAHGAHLEHGCTMTPDNSFECLLVCRDPAIFGTMARALSDLSISSNICLSSSKAANVMAERSTDLIVIDWEGDASTELLSKIWKSPRKQKPTIVAISTADRPIPGVHIVLQKPITAESGAKSLKTAYSKMLHDHRKHARYTLMIPAIAVCGTDRKLPVTVLDLGDSGVGLRTQKALATGAVLSFPLLLPGAKRAIHIHARVMWSSDQGRVGCEFLRLPPLDVDILQDWLTRKSQVRKPLIKA
jgi:hypothetical protein